MRTKLVRMKSGAGYAYRLRRKTSSEKDLVYVLTKNSVFMGSIYGSDEDAYAVTALAVSGNGLPDDATDLLNLGIAETSGLGWDHGDEIMSLSENEKNALLLERCALSTTTPKRVLYSDLAQEEKDDLFSRFIKKRCTACGGNWVAMLELAVKTDFPDVWVEAENTLPDYGHGGIPRFAALADIIHKCIATEFDKDNNYLK